MSEYEPVNCCTACEDQYYCPNFDKNKIQCDISGRELEDAK